jgi:two-component system, LuxR family, response regulator FixJ
MERQAVIVFDPVHLRRRALAEVLHNVAVVSEVGDLSELGDAWPSSAWVFVPDDNAVVMALHQQLAQRRLFHPIVVYSEAATTGRAVSAILGGAMNYVAWPCSAAELLAAITGSEPAAARRSRHVAARLEARAKLAQLTPREHEVIVSTRYGLSSKEIGRLLRISFRTVEIYRANAFAKLGVRSAVAAAELVIMADEETDWSLAA